MTLLAEGVLNAYWDHKLPVNLARIAKGMEVVVAFAPLGRVCALVELAAKRKPRIVIDRQHPLERQRYGVAHALGHIALHHLRPGQTHAIEVSDSYHCNVQERIDNEANDFALRLLLPEAALRAQVQPLTPVEALAQVFQVAPILIKQRMADLNLPWPRTLAQQLRPEATWDD